MKATELMINDWVLDGKKPAQITGIFCDDLFETTISPSVSGDCLSPIPITPEILEQNGFVKQDYDGWQISEDNSRGLIEYRTDYFDGFLIISYTKKPFSKISVKLKHVHELQHALRLCKIDKEITI